MMQVELDEAELLAAMAAHIEAKIGRPVVGVSFSRTKGGGCRVEFSVQQPALALGEK